MKKSWIAMIFMVLVFGAGCAWVKQAQEDIAISNATPIQPGEVSPDEKADRFSNLFNNLPWGASALAVPLIGFIAANELRRRRGKAIRQQTQNTSVNPITGHIGNAIGFEAVVQWLADLRAAVFEVGPDGSATKRGWKAVLYSLIGSASFGHLLYPTIVNTLQNFTSNPPTWLHGAALSVAVATGTGIIAFLEKKMQKVLPISTPTTSVSTVGSPTV